MNNFLSFLSYRNSQSTLRGLKTWLKMYSVSTRMYTDVLSYTHITHSLYYYWAFSVTQMKSPSFFVLSSDNTSVMDLFLYSSEIALNVEGKVTVIVCLCDKNLIPPHNRIKSF